MRTAHRELAIQLRKQGKSYSEILSQVPVAKSTLSLWFRSANLATIQKQRMTALRRDAALRGALAQRQKRLSEISELSERGRDEVGNLSNREIWLIGTALYWAEGSKQNSRSPSTGLLFSNSDPKMILLFLRWLKLVGVEDSSVVIELYVHKSRAREVEEFKVHWARSLGVSVSKFDRVYLKSGNPATQRVNTGDLYRGLLRIKVKSSTSLNRKVSGWIEGIAQ